LLQLVNILLLRASHAGIVFIQYFKNSFLRCPDKREIWHATPVPNFTFVGAEMWKYSLQNCQNFEFWPENLPLRGDSFAAFLPNSQRFYTRLQVAFKFLVCSLSGDKQPSYKYFPRWGNFPKIFNSC